MKRLACLLLTLTACSSSEPPFAYIEVTTPTTQRANALPDFGSAPKAPVSRSEPRKASRGTPRTPAPPSGDVWGRLRQCESGGNYQAVSASGKYRGAYQFSFATWRAVGGSGDPAQASPAEQDMRAQMLAARSNPYTQWPICWKRAVGG